jgi:hypothetical protein
MYRVRLEKVIWVDEERKDMYTHLFRDIELPFSPFVGLEISFRGWSSGKAEKVTWDFDSERFVVEVKDEVPFSSTDYDFTVEWLLQHALKQGWLNHAS